MSIPKIIHQTGPSDKIKWHPMWFKCQESWLKHFPDYEYKFWNDEDIDNLVKDSYPEYWEMYSSFPNHIMKIDFVRFCFMDKFGGIYADLDYFCYKNFEHMLANTTYLVENPFGNDPIENSLFVSQPNTKFFKLCLEECKLRYDSVKKNYSVAIDYAREISRNKKTKKVLRPYLVFYVSGTNLLSTVFRNYSSLVSTLPGDIFNNLDYSYDKSYYAKHIHTGTWGKEDLEDEDFQKHFATLRNIPVDSYNFYYDYSNGEYKSNYQMDWDKNNVDPYPNLMLEYSYS